MNTSLGNILSCIVVLLSFIIIGIGGIEGAAIIPYTILFFQYSEISPKFCNYFTWEDKYTFLTVVAHTSNLVCIYSSFHLIFEATNYSNLKEGFSGYFILIFVISASISAVIHFFYRKK